MVLKNLLQMHLKLLQEERFKKTAEVTGGLTGNQIADKITKVWKTSPQNNSEINGEEVHRERYISPKERQKIIYDLRLIQ